MKARGIGVLVIALAWSIARAPSAAIAQRRGEAAARVSEPGLDSPWGQGVALADRQRARSLYRQGNQRFAAGTYARAAELYERALAAWDHPAIRYNLAVCLIELDQAVPAFRNLQRGMGFGVEPLGDARFMKGLEYLRKLRPRVAELTVVCTRERGSIAIDGRRLLACAGRATAIVAPGRHLLVAREPGFPTTGRRIELAGGERETVVLEVGGGMVGIELLAGAPVGGFSEGDSPAVGALARIERRLSGSLALTARAGLVYHGRASQVTIQEFPLLAGAKYSLGVRPLRAFVTGDIGFILVRQSRSLLSPRLASNRAHPGGSVGGGMTLGRVDVGVGLWFANIDGVANHRMLIATVSYNLASR